MTIRPNHSLAPACGKKAAPHFFADIFGSIAAKTDHSESTRVNDWLTLLMRQSPRCKRF
jgi:hypothetical protein